MGRRGHRAVSWDVPAALGREMEVVRRKLDDVWRAIH